MATTSPFAGVPVSGPFRANNSEVLREAIAGGLGIGLLPGFSVLRDSPKRGLVPLLLAWRPSGFFGDRIYAIRTWSPRPPRAVECVIRHLKECLGVIGN
jgi:DNA-binding transcriptional LysR family regulator